MGSVGCGKLMVSGKRTDDERVGFLVAHVICRLLERLAELHPLQVRRWQALLALAAAGFQVELP